MGGLSRRTAGAMIAAGLALLVPAGAFAKESPNELLKRIYLPYQTKGYKGVDYTRPSFVRNTFEPALAAAMLRDFEKANKRQEVPTLDGDPFIDAQDWEIADVKIEIRVTGTKATATVNFTNFKEPKTVTLDLVQTPAGWRIYEITAPSGSVRKLFKLK